METSECHGASNTGSAEGSLNGTQVKSEPEDDASEDEENDGNWDNSLPVEVNIDTLEPAKTEGDTTKKGVDSEDDFLGFEDPLAKQSRARWSKESNRCPHCEYWTRRKDHFKRHVLRHPEQTLYPSNGSSRKERRDQICATCGYTTHRSDHFKRHLMRHTGERPFSCLTCGYSTTHAIHLKRHIKRHGHTAKPFPSDITNNTESTVNNEEKTEEPVKIKEEKEDEPIINGNADVNDKSPEEVNCEIKAEPMPNGDTGEEWVSGVWPPVEVSIEELGDAPRKRSRQKGPHVCKDCGYATLRGDHFKRHLMRHTGEKPYSCTLCDYRSTHAIHLKRHMSTHTNDRPYVCHLCPFRAIRPHHLRDHIRIHTGERPYVCHICGFSAAQSGNYKSHMRTHSADKPYTCTICGYSTVKNSNLITHMRIHTGEKAFSCDVCDFKAMKSAEVMLHKREVHNFGAELIHLLAT